MERKILQHRSHTITLSTGTILVKIKKNAKKKKKKENTGISKIKRAVVLKGIFSDTAYVCVLTWQM